MHQHIVVLYMWSNDDDAGQTGFNYHDSRSDVFPTTRLWLPPWVFFLTHDSVFLKHDSFWLVFHKTRFSLASFVPSSFVFRLDEVIIILIWKTNKGKFKIFRWNSHQSIYRYFVLSLHFLVATHHSFEVIADPYSIPRFFESRSRTSSTIMKYTFSSSIEKYLHLRISSTSLRLLPRSTPNSRTKL